MDREFSDILKQIGFTDGLHVPVANEENIKLQKEVEEKLKRKADLIVKKEIQDDQLNRIKDQIKNLIIQKEQNQELIVAMRNQRDTEVTLLRESEANLNRTRQQNRECDKQMRQSQHNQQLLQEEIAHSMKRLDHLKSLVEWGEEARRAWQEELAAGQRDNDVLERFKVEDDTKFKEMELKRQRLKADVIERESILTNELNVLTTLENQLEQVARLFRRSHNERMSLISYWENAVRILHQRDANIDSTLQEIDQLKELGQEKMETLAEERKFYETQCQNNEELRRQTDELNNQTVNQRQQNLSLTETTGHLTTDSVVQFDSEATVPTDVRRRGRGIAPRRMRQPRFMLPGAVATLRGVMRELGVGLSKERSRNSQLTNELRAKQAELEELHWPLGELRGRLHELSNADLSAAQRTNEIDTILQVAEKNNNVLISKVEKLQEKVFEKTTELDTLKNTSKLMAGEMKIFDVNKKAYEKRASEIECQVIQKEQMLYELDMELVTLESAMARLQGERSVEEKQALMAKSHDLEENLRHRSEVFMLVTAQYNKAKNEQVHLSEEVEAETEQLRRLTEKRQELVYLIEGGHKQLRSLQARNRQAQVTVSMLRLRTDQRQRALSHTHSQLTTLQREKLQLENALRDRRVEIGLQMDLVSAKKRSLEEEKSELKKALERLQIRVGQLQTKHDIVMDSLGKEDGGENFSVAHFKIKMAQERHELQEIGDDLDSKIKKAENEIPAMENTLRVISAANDCYKRNLDSIDSDSPEMQEKKSLEEKLENMKINVKERQADVKQITSQIHELDYSLCSLGECEERLRGEWKERDTAARALDRELQEYGAKLERADKQLRKLRKDVRQLREPRVPIHLAEKDIELRELQDINQSALQQLAELTTRYAEVGPVLGRYLGEKGLKLPMVRTKPSGGSTLSTTRSLMSEDSQAPSIILLDPDTISPATKGPIEPKSSRLSGGRKKSK